MMLEEKRKSRLEILRQGCGKSYGGGRASHKYAFSDLAATSRCRGLRGGTFRYHLQAPRFCSEQAEHTEIAPSPIVYASYRLYQIEGKQKCARSSYLNIRDARVAKVRKGLRRGSLRCSQYQWLRRYADAAAEGIAEFCRQQGILNELKSAIGLVEKCFWSSDLKLEKEVDSETGDTQIVISVLLRNKSREDVLAAYQAYRKQLVKTVPWPQRSLIRLSYDLL
jgi:hypothetical protein